jgi:hypothetical protein
MGHGIHRFWECGYFGRVIVLPSAKNKEVTVKFS